MKKRNIVSGIIAILVVGAYLSGTNFKREPDAPPLEPSGPAPKAELQPEPEPPPKPETVPEPAAPVYEAGKFGPDDLRREYISGEMILKVPRMDFEGPVYSDIRDITPGSASYQGVSNEILNTGVALFGAAQVPTDSNSNVSIAGHRDIYGMEFYDIDKVTDGDYIYLTFRGKEYVYLFEESHVTEDNDWSLISTKDYGCVTLQSCTPINIASHRIFVVGRLVEIREPDKPPGNGA